ncbi:MAG: hydroxymethylglutaryl-CoA synthase [Candidatus Anstonellales archaeon]
MVGIVGWGAYVPRYRIRVDEIASVWGEEGWRVRSGLGVEEKAVPGTDEDAATMAVEASRIALSRAGISATEIGSVYVGSESHPYAVKPTATVVAQAIGAPNAVMCADLEFACKAGTAGIQCCMGLVKSRMIRYGLAIGTDTAQGRPGDALEYTAASGAAAYIIGDKKEEVVAEIEETVSFTTDTPDFWRRQHAEFPQHGGRFTGTPAYFRHVISATQMLFEKTGTLAKDYDYVIFHQPNGKFPREAARKLGIEEKKLEVGLLSPKIGNTYSAASLMGLANVLDRAKPSETILLTSFGSGAGSDAFSIRVTERIEEARKRGCPLSKFLESVEYISYGKYVKQRSKLNLI